LLGVVLEEWVLRLWVAVAVVLAVCKQALLA
jgi:hypothetical protein